MAAVAGSNLFDFLVDIVPRGQESAKSGSKKDSAKGGDEDEGDEEDEDGDEGDERDAE
jgi:hypothetical protein